MSNPQSSRAVVEAALDVLAQESEEWTEEMAHFFDDGEEDA